MPKIELVQGDITEENTDAIINPTDHTFSLNDAISKKIVEKGGQKIRDDCATRGTLTNVEMTQAAGQLKCKHLVHVLFPQNIPECQTRIIESLHLVTNSGLRSLSIPLIRAGCTKFSSYQVAFSITEAIAIEAQKRNLANLKLIRLVGYTANEKDYFERALDQSKTKFSALQNPVKTSAPNLVENPVTPTPPLPPPPHQLESLEINGVTFAVALGDLTDEKTDAIVNPTDDKFQLDGILSKAIVSKGGFAIAKECRTFGSVPTGGTVVTNGGALPCRHVVHVVSPDDLLQCRQAVQAVLQGAAAKKFTSISFPPIGAGGKKLPLDQVANCIVETLADAANQKNIGSIKLVRLVGFTFSIKAAFEAALKQAKQRNINFGQSNSSNDPNLTRPASSPTTLPSQSPQPINAAIQTPIHGSIINGVRLQVVEGDITDEATDAIVNPTDEKMMLTGIISQKILAKGGQSIKIECKKIVTLMGVALTSAGSLKCHHIVHVLWPKNTTECTRGVSAVLRLCATQQFGSIAIPLIGASRWKQLDQVAVCITEEVATAARSGTLGSLTLVRLVGVNLKEKDAFGRALKLSAAQTSALNAPKCWNLAVFRAADGGNKPSPVLSLPDTWAPMDPKRNWSQVLMQQSDDDYNDALNLFTLKDKNLQKIFRIQNPTLYQQYQLEKFRMEIKYKAKNGKWPFQSHMEQSLYHGTEKAVVRKICDNGFNRSYCGKNAVLYGCGSYFARDMSFSADDQYSEPTPLTGEKYAYIYIYIYILVDMHVCTCMHVLFSGII